jgi:hypothetical protein
LPAVNFAAVVELDEREVEVLRIRARGLGCDRFGPERLELQLALADGRRRRGAGHNGLQRQQRSDNYEETCDFHVNPWRG